jgi:hypothetical protein
VDRIFGVESGGDGPAEGFDGGNGGGGGTRYDNVDGRGEHVGAPGEEFDAVLDAMDGAGLVKFFDGYEFGGVDAFLVDPVLDFVEVNEGHLYSVSGVQILAF